MFKLGTVVATQGILDVFNIEDILILLARYSGGDWGEIRKEDTIMNEKAIAKGGKIWGSYSTDKGKVWIITEPDRNSTCVLFPDEY